MCLSVSITFEELFNSLPCIDCKALLSPKNSGISKSMMLLVFYHEYQLKINVPKGMQFPSLSVGKSRLSLALRITLIQVVFRKYLKNLSFYLFHRIYLLVFPGQETHILVLLNYLTQVLAPCIC